VRRAATDLIVGRGSWVALIDGQEDHSRGVATETGTALATFDDKRTGSICFSFTLTTSDHGKSHTGRFSTLGGTGRAARVGASGTVASRPVAGAGPVQGDGTADGEASYRTLRRARSLTAACRRLASL
jgi:hypothetical protein